MILNLTNDIRASVHVGALHIAITVAKTANTARTANALRVESLTNLEDTINGTFLRRPNTPLLDTIYATNE